MPRTKSNTFAPDQIVVATKTFATDKAVVHVGEKYRGGDRVVQDNWTAFVDGDTLPSELPNFWHDQVPPPVDHRAPIQPTVPIAPHRQVRAKYDVWAPGQWAPGSDGEKRGVPPPLVRHCARARSWTSAILAFELGQSISSGSRAT